jgi:hypothetical protein
MIQITRLPTKCFDYPQCILATQFSFPERFRAYTFSTGNEVPGPQKFHLAVVIRFTRVFSVRILSKISARDARMAVATFSIIPFKDGASETTI